MLITVLTSYLLGTSREICSLAYTDSLWANGSFDFLKLLPVAQGIIPRVPLKVHRVLNSRLEMEQRVRTAFGNVL